ncbi:hypothetical protein [Desulfuromonas thiophila]|uniref:Uncharacterized protein n=1 Tax=Desulfuromonas thiophila TaxID=57664 RepID=A0A1G7CXJ0_9BACT|nr:hypothetical protein [Desulfuromonas thiophila]SDE43500.1 hypothetical protein SAMN05661003_1119 [Desulfuromonas thiophila]
MTSVSEQANDILIVIDVLDRIETIGGSWQEAAAAGGAETALRPDSLIGQPLTRFISGDATRMYHEALLKLCRLTDTPLQRDYRCDTPECERHMRMWLRRLDRRRVEMRHRLLELRPLPHPLRLQTTAAAATAKPFVRCSVCNRLRPPGSNQWLEPADVVPPAAAPLQVIHSVCPDCRQRDWCGGRLRQR